MEVAKKPLATALCLLGKLKGAESVRLREVGDGKLQLECYHDRTWIVVRVAGVAGVAGFGPPIEVGRKALAKVGGALSGSFELRAHPDRLDLIAGKRRLKVDISTEPIMPALPEPRARSLVMAWEIGQFRSALAFVAPAVCDDITRTHLTKFGLFPELGLAATNGHRLHLHRMCTFPFPVQFPAVHGPILLKALAEADKHASIRLDVADGSTPDRGPHWRWQVGNDVEIFSYGESDADVAGHELERMFRCVLKLEPKLSITRGASAVREAFALAAKVREGVKGMQISFRERELVISSEGFSEAIEINGPATPLALFMEPSYAMEAIPVDAEWLQIEARSELDAVFFRTASTTAAVMPRRE